MTKLCSPGVIFLRTRFHSSRNPGRAISREKLIEQEYEILQELKKQRIRKNARTFVARCQSFCASETPRGLEVPKLWVGPIAQTCGLFPLNIFTRDVNLGYQHRTHFRVFSFRELSGDSLNFFFAGTSWLCKWHALFMFPPFWWSRCLPQLGLAGDRPADLLYHRHLAKVLWLHTIEFREIQEKQIVLESFFPLDVRDKIQHGDVFQLGIGRGIRGQKLNAFLHLGTNMPALSTKWLFFF